MQWRDEAIILGARRFGESGLILDVLTSLRGRQSGLVHGGASRRRRAQYEAGNSISVAWTGRLEEQLGRFETAEIQDQFAARHLDDPSALLAVAAIAELLRQSLDEGDDGGSSLYQPTLVLLQALEDAELWPALYVRWELGLLSELGFGLDLERCTLSGAAEGLTHVSPNTGRAVVGSEAQDYLDRLLPLPAFLVDSAREATDDDIRNGLKLTGHFLETRLFNSVNRTLPPIRTHLVRRFLSGEKTVRSD